MLGDDTTRILVADSDRLSRVVTMWCLLSEGFKVVPVSNGFDAADMLETRRPPDLAIVDLGLQGLSGRSLIELMRASERLNGVPIIATGLVEPFAPLPPDVIFLMRPYDYRLLLTTIRSLVPEGLKSLFHRIPTPSPISSVARAES